MEPIAEGEKANKEAFSRFQGEIARILEQKEREGLRRELRRLQEEDDGA